MLKKTFFLFAVVFSTAFHLFNTYGQTAGYRLSATGDTLFITGSGDMPNYDDGDYNPSPWFPNRDNITTVIIQSGVRSIGEHAFYQCANLTSVTIAGTITSIGVNAFAFCRNLVSIALPGSISFIDEGVFWQCSNLMLIKMYGYPPTVAAVTALRTAATYHVPCNALTNYQDAPVWSGLNIQPFPTVITERNATICYGENYTISPFNIINQQITAVFADTLQTATGCDSIIKLNLTVRPQIDSTVTTTSTTLSAVQAGAIYQWLDCSAANAPIVGANEQTFTPTADGNYAVNITVNDCQTTSVCISFTGVGINEFFIKSINLYPNPVRDQLSIESGELTIRSVEITDISGRTIISVGEGFPYPVATTRQSMFQNINVSSLPAGAYFVKMETDKGIIVKKIIKN